MAQAAQADLVQRVLALLVRAVHVRPVLVHHDQASAVLARASAVPVLQAAALQVSVPHVRVALQPAAVVVAAALPVHSVRVALAVRQRPASRSVQSAKSSSREAHQALAVQLFHAATAPPYFAFVAALAFRTLPTRSMRTQVS